MPGKINNNPFMGKRPQPKSPRKNGKVTIMPVTPKYQKRAKKNNMPVTPNFKPRKRNLG